MFNNLGLALGTTCNFQVTGEKLILRDLFAPPILNRVNNKSRVQMYGPA